MLVSLLLACGVDLVVTTALLSAAQRPRACCAAQGVVLLDERHLLGASRSHPRVHGRCVGWLRSDSHVVPDSGLGGACSEKLALFTAFSCSWEACGRASVLRCASRRVSALFAGHYTEFLICPAVLGIAVFVHQRATGRLSVVSLPIYGVFMAIWATCVSAYCSGYVQVAGVALRWFRHSCVTYAYRAMLEFWKRREVLLAKLWGMSGTH